MIAWQPEGHQTPRAHTQCSSPASSISSLGGRGGLAKAPRLHSLGGEGGHALAAVSLGVVRGGKGNDLSVQKGAL